MQWVLQCWKGWRTNNEEREASMNFFRQFTVQKTRLPLPAVRLSCLHIQWFAYMDAICKECLWIKCVFAPKFLVYRFEIKGFVNELILILSPKINSFRKQYSGFPLLTLKFCCLPGKFRKHMKFVTFIVYSIDEIPAIFSN